MDLLGLWSGADPFEALCRGVGSGLRFQQVTGLTGSDRSYLMAAVWARTGRTGLVVVGGNSRAERLAEDLRTFLPGHEVLVFPPREVLPYEVIAESPERTAERLKVLRRLKTPGPVLVVAAVEAVAGRMVPPGRLGWQRLVSGQAQDLRMLLVALGRMGYERHERVEAPGTMAQRGGIVDVWDPAAPAPVRVEFFGDQIESIRRIDPERQRSEERLAAVELGPAREVVVDAEAARTGLIAIRRELEATVSRLRRTGHRAAADRLRDRVEGHLLAWGDAPAGDGLDRFLPYFYPEPASLLDHMPQGLLTMVDEPERVRQMAADAERVAAERAASLLEEGQVLGGQSEIFVSWPLLEARLGAQPRIEFASLPTRQLVTPDRVYEVASRSGTVFHGQWGLFLKQLQERRNDRWRVVIMAATRDRGERLLQALTDEGVPTRVGRGEAAPPQPREVVIEHGSLQSGFALDGLRLWLLTDSEVFGRPKHRRRAAPRERAGTALLRQEDLKIGDYVVHTHHGIGRYRGIRTIEVQGHEKDYLHLEYQGGDSLYVPVEQINLVQKYVGQEGHEPRVYRLGGGDWQKVKNRVRASVREMAEELLKLYAAREALPGHAFGPDTPWQAELEDQFPYEETPDQLQAIEDVKRDMERPRPMDRLICGDVGYGKTEVAIRAAFKAIAGGKQAAVLVPTTILAQQHYATFRQRLAGFPVTVTLLSRFRSPREQAEAIRALREGTVDLVIGTHRLLGSDVKFHDLGLLIIDEEQRFGVAHKEKIKKIKEGVDVLTLTATPIPRTLHMGMVGMRDMSVIETPPEDRFPVQTYVAEYDEELVRDAIRRELGRSGQVFYVHNRVGSIDAISAKLHRLVPEARVAVAHGQMDENQLEATMLDFLEGDYDILLSTTIIESGLDMPRVNTLVVEDADRLGLAQLYQLRGRIGRSSRLAYAYFTYRADKVVAEAAQKRLEAIREFTEFGAGFKIAMRDLQIRGSGNILGPEQHGFILAVGFDLYCQLLEEETRQLKGQMVETPPTPTIEIPLDAYVPDTYITDPRQKIEVYKRAAQLRTLAEVEDLAAEVEDRFGPLPPPLQNLLSVARLRVRAEELEISAIVQENDRFRLKLARVSRLSAERIAELGARFRGRVTFHAGQAPEVTLRVPGSSPEEFLPLIEEVLTFLTPQAVSA